MTALQKKQFIISIVASVFVLAGIQILWGFHLQNYELFLNYLVQDIALKKDSAPILIETGFGILPVLSWIQQFTSAVSIYGWYKILLLGINLFVICYWCIDRLNPKLGLALFFILSFLLLDNLVFINGNKLALLFLFSSLFVLQLRLRKSIKLFLFSACILLSLLSRIDIAFIVIGFLLSCFVFYPNKQGLKYFLPAFAFSFLAGGLFVILVTLNVDGLKDFFTTERAIQDRQDFILEKSPTDPELSKEELEIFKLGFFMLDSDHPVELSHKTVAKHSGIFEYIFQNKELKSIYFDKLEELKKEIVERYLGQAILCVLAWIFMLYYHFSKNTKRSTFILLSTLYIALPLAINLIAFIEITFFSNYLLLPFVFGLILFLSPENTKSRKTYFLIFILAAFSAYNFISYVKPNISEYYETNKKASKLIESFKQQATISNKAIYLANFYDYQSFLPSDPFYNFNDAKLVFLDVGPYNYLAYFQHEYQANFGENYTSLSHRIRVIEENTSTFYSTEERFLFLKNYLSKVSNLDIQFELVDTSVSRNLNQYQFSIIAE